MTDLKVHKGIMTAKLRCGATIDCEVVSCAILVVKSELEIKAERWRVDGHFYSPDRPSIFDIVEIVSKPPARTLKEVRAAGELVDGMLFKNKYQDGRFVQVMVSKTDNKPVGVLSDESSSLGAYDLTRFREDSAASYVLVEGEKYDKT